MGVAMMMWHVAGMQKCRLMFYLLLHSLSFRSLSLSLHALKFVYWIFPDVFRWGVQLQKETKLLSWAQACSVVSLSLSLALLCSPGSRQDVAEPLATLRRHHAPRFAWHSKFKAFSLAHKAGAAG